MDPEAIAALSREVQHNKAALAAFKTWLTDGRQRRLFRTPEDLQLAVTDTIALRV